MHLWQDDHRSHVVFSVHPVTCYIILIYSIIYFDYLIMLISARFLQCKVTLFLFESNKHFVSWAWWFTPVIPALWEAEAGRSRGQKIKTILANMAKPRLY